MGCDTTKEQFDAAVKILQPYFDGAEPFSAASLDYVVDFVASAKLQPLLRQHRDSLRPK
jgi:hypothetical protein